MEACFVLYQPVLSKEHVEQAYTLLVKYCNPCMATNIAHLTCTCAHMLSFKRLLLDFGPLSAFWCFPYEIYNGLLEGVSKSWIRPEKQKFLGMQKIKHLKFT